MTPEIVVQVIRQALMATFWLAAPLLAIGFIAGLVISLVQIATSMQDNAFSTIPRLLAFLAGLLFLLPWMLHRMMGYTIALFGDQGRDPRRNGGRGATSPAGGAGGGATRDGADPVDRLGTADSQL